MGERIIVRFTFLEFLFAGSRASNAPNITRRRDSFDPLLDRDDSKHDRFVSKIKALQSETRWNYFLRFEAQSTAATFCATCLETSCTLRRVKIEDRRNFRFLLTLHAIVDFLLLRLDPTPPLGRFFVRSSPHPVLVTILLASNINRFRLTSASYTSVTIRKFFVARVVRSRRLG